MLNTIVGFFALNLEKSVESGIRVQAIGFRVHTKILDSPIR